MISAPFAYSLLVNRQMIAARAYRQNKILYQHVFEAGAYDHAASKTIRSTD